ncbi:MAG TPA: glycerol-3-phosphate acyltransferase, partial [Acidimicrobiales bacterium]
MTSDLQSSAAVTCACWVGAFVLGSVPIGHLLRRSRLRRDFRRLEGRQAPADLRALLGGGVTDPATALPRATDLVGAALDTAKVLGLAAAALALVRLASPGVRAGEVPPFSGVGSFGVEVLTFWQSACLWAGLAAGVGHLWSMWLGFRSTGQAQAPLLALAVRYTPTAFVVAVVGYLLGRVTGSQRVAVLTSLTGFVAWTWAG